MKLFLNTIYYRFSNNVIYNIYIYMALKIYIKIKTFFFIYQLHGGAFPLMPHSYSLVFRHFCRKYVHVQSWGKQPVVLKESEEQYRQGRIRKDKDRQGQTRTNENGQHKNGRGRKSTEKYGIWPTKTNLDRKRTDKMASAAF